MSPELRTGKKSFFKSHIRKGFSVSFHCLIIKTSSIFEIFATWMTNDVGCCNIHMLLMQSKMITAFPSPSCLASFSMLSFHSPNISSIVPLSCLWIFLGRLHDTQSDTGKHICARKCLLSSYTCSLLFSSSKFKSIAWMWKTKPTMVWALFVIYSCGTVRLSQTTYPCLQQKFPGILFMIFGLN